MKRLAVLALLPAVCCAQSLNPSVTPDNIKRTICVPNWTAGIRPPVSYTNALKRQLLAQQHVPSARMRDYELDHVVPLALGGHPRDPHNLRLQPWNGPDGAHAKDVVEAKMHRAVCAGRVGLGQAQTCFMTNWKDCK